MAISTSAAGLAALAAGCRRGLRWALLLPGVLQPFKGWVIRGPPGPLGAVWESPEALLREPSGGRSVRRSLCRPLPRPGGEGPQRGTRRGLLAPASPPVFFVVLWHVFRAAGGRVARGEAAGLQGRGFGGQRARPGPRGGASRGVTRPGRLCQVRSSPSVPLSPRTVVSPGPAPISRLTLSALPPAPPRAEADAERIVTSTVTARRRGSASPVRALQSAGVPPRGVTLPFFSSVHAPGRPRPAVAPTPRCYPPVHATIFPWGRGGAADWPYSGSGVPRIGPHAPSGPMCAVPRSAALRGASPTAPPGRGRAPLVCPRARSSFPP